MRKRMLVRENGGAVAGVGGHLRMQVVAQMGQKGGRRRAIGPLLRLQKSRHIGGATIALPSTALRLRRRRLRSGPAVCRRRGSAPFVGQSVNRRRR